MLLKNLLEAAKEMLFAVAILGMGRVCTVSTLGLSEL